MKSLPAKLADPVEVACACPLFSDNVLFSVGFTSQRNNLFS